MSAMDSGYGLETWLSRRKLGLHGKAVGEMQRWLLSQVLDDPARNTAEKLSALAQIHMEEL